MNIYAKCPMSRPGTESWKPIIIILACLSPLILFHGIIELTGIGHGSFYFDAVILGFLEIILVLLTWGCVVLFYLKKRGVTVHI